MLFCFYYSHPRYVWLLGVGVKEEQTEESNDIVKCPPLSPPNPNDKPAFLSYNNLWTNSHPRYARPLGVGVLKSKQGSILKNLWSNSRPRYAWLLGVEVKEEQTEESNNILKSPPHSQLNPNDEPAFLSYNNLWSNSRASYSWPLNVGVTEKEQTEGSNGIVRYPPTTPCNPNHEPLAFCVLLSHNNLSSNSHHRYARPLNVGVKEEQTGEAMTL